MTKEEAQCAERIYSEYPRKVAKQAALKAIVKAVLDVSKRDGAPAEPCVWLLDRVKAYAAAVKAWPANDRRFIPHPATWFNQGRYDDDDAEWRRGGANAARVHGGNGSVYGRVDFGG